MPNKVLFGPEKLATTSTPGLLKASGSGSGLQLDSSGYLKLSYPGASTIKAGSNLYAPVVVGIQHESVFYGLAKAAGDSTQAASSNTVGTYTDNAKTAIQNMLSVAPTASPIFTGSISMGRKANTTIGDCSLAVGQEITASGGGSFAMGYATKALDYYDYAEGYATTAKGIMSHAEGGLTTASGQASHAEGVHTTASGYCSHAEGTYTIATGEVSHVGGRYNVADNFNSWDEWVAGTSYTVGAYVKRTVTTNNETTVTGYQCRTANSDSTFNSQHWYIADPSTYAEIIGNGVDNARSNARSLDWDGNEYLKGYLYVGCNADSSGGTRVPHDIQINSTSIVNDGVANIPLATTTTAGVSIASGMGIKVNSLGELYLYPAPSARVKEGTNIYVPIMPSNQHEAVFYGLAKAAGDTTQASSSNTVGNYTEIAKSKISEMLDSPVTIATNNVNIGAHSGIRYVCGEMTYLSVVAPESGCVDVLFKSGSTPTTLTVTSAKSGVTAITWANGFDPAALEANTTYEINILDGEYGVACKWT